VSDLVAEYVALEREILAHRLRVLLRGEALAADDPVELRIEGESDRLWRAMKPEDRRRLDAACDRPTSAWIAPPAGPEARGAGLVVWIRALADAVEVSLPPATRERLAPSRARGGRLLLPWTEFEGRALAAHAVLLDAAFLLLGRSADSIGTEGGLLLVNPDTGELILSSSSMPSGVAEAPPREGPLIYRAGNAGVDLTIHRRAWEAFEAAKVPAKWVVWGLVEEPDRVLLLTPEAVREHILPRPDETGRLPDSWTGRTRSTKASGGSWTQPFRRSELELCIVPLGALVGELGPETRVLEFRTRSPAWSLRTPREFAAVMRRRNRRARPASQVEKP
jgi:hypothetical protein